ncbi:MAG: Dabb family protein [Planctomycetes bacterium]|nr:Dabb family protein [Planctomycetota bacterium]
MIHAPTRVLLAALLLATAGCGTPQVFTPGAGRLMHTVCFWMKSDAPPDAAQQLADFYSTEVPRVPGIVSVFAGLPRPSERSVVDDSFSLCVCTLFVDSAAEQIWQSHPIHVALKQRFEPWLDRVVVFDALE